MRAEGPWRSSDSTGYRKLATLIDRDEQRLARDDLNAAQLVDRAQRGHGRIGTLCDVPQRIARAHAITLVGRPRCRARVKAWVRRDAHSDGRHSRKYRNMKVSRM